MMGFFSAVSNRAVRPPACDPQASVVVLIQPDVPCHEAGDDHRYPQHPILDGKAVDGELVNQTFHDRLPNLWEGYAQPAKKYC
jgi:hypothetical protein